MHLTVPDIWAGLGIQHGRLLYVRHTLWRIANKQQVRHPTSGRNVRWPRRKSADNKPSLKWGMVRSHEPFKFWCAADRLRCCHLRWTVSVVNWWWSRSPVYHADRRHLCTIGWAGSTASHGSVSGDLFSHSPLTESIFSSHITSHCL